TTPPLLTLAEVLTPGNASQAVDIKQVENLLLSGCDLFGWKGYQGESLLHLAISRDIDSQLLEYLLQIGIPVNIQDTSGNTPLHLASQTMDIAKYQILLKY